MAHTLTSLLAVAALLIQALLVGGHVHLGADARAAAGAVSSAVQTQHEHGGSKPVAPDASNCSLCQGLQVAGVYLAGAAADLEAPVLAPAPAQRMTVAAAPRKPASVTAWSRAPPRPSFSVY
jgi:hypothetical protein